MRVIGEVDRRGYGKLRQMGLFFYAFTMELSFLSRALIFKSSVMIQNDIDISHPPFSTRYSKNLGM